MALTWLDDIRTQFVRDRVKETSFDDREYIHDLYLIEKLQSGRSLGLAFHMSGGVQKLYGRYPAEAECIRLEMKEGRYIDAAGFTAGRLQWRQVWEDRNEAERVAREQDEARKTALKQAELAAAVQQERDVWLEMGGAR